VGSQEYYYFSFAGDMPSNGPPIAGSLTSHFFPAGIGKTITESLIDLMLAQNKNGLQIRYKLENLTSSRIFTNLGRVITVM
jgi:hypothetical protein